MFRVLTIKIPENVYKMVKHTQTIRTIVDFEQVIVSWVCMTRNAQFHQPNTCSK